MVSRSCDVIELQLFSIDHLKVGKVVQILCSSYTMFVTKLDQDLISVLHMYCISLDVICTPKKVFFCITDADGFSRRFFLRACAERDFSHVKSANEAKDLQVFLFNVKMIKTSAFVKARRYSSI